MRLLVIDFHYEKVQKQYEDKKQSRQMILMLLNRCVRFYSAIDYLNTIFKLLVKRDQHLAQTNLRESKDMKS
jgi:hypothetical protein